MKKYIYMGILSIIMVSCANNVSNVNKVSNIMSDDRMKEISLKEQNKLKNQEYKIYQIVDKKSLQQYKNDNEWALVIENNNFGLFVGCNRIFGAIQQTNNEIVFNNVASTKMMCEITNMQLENLVLNNLTKLNITNDGLENENIKITFDKNQ